MLTQHEGQGLHTKTVEKVGGHLGPESVGRSGAFAVSVNQGPATLRLRVSRWTDTVIVAAIGLNVSVKPGTSRGCNELAAP